MKVQNFKTTCNNGRKRVSAEILWETADRPREAIYFEVDEEFADDLACNPDAFFLATVFPALYYGEERFAIEAKVCPELYQGVKEVLGIYNHWYYRDKREPLNLEIQTRSKVSEDDKNKNSAFFFSGGIDSYATYVENRSVYSKEHPHYIKDGIVAFGLEQDDPNKFEHVISMLEEVARRFEINLLPVYTNIYLIYRDEDALNNFYFWISEFQGAALASIAHILNKRLGAVSIASTFDILNLAPYGSHPLVDPNFSNSNLRMCHDGLIYSRLEKVRMVTKYLTLPFKLRVCNRFVDYESSKLNCGKCEKCIRTMLEFLAIGELDNINVFPFHDVKKDMIMSNINIDLPYPASCYRELIEPLKKKNRDDLVTAIEHKLKTYDKKNSSIRNKILKLDEKIFNKNIKKTYHSLKKFI